jgi:uncharacterized protein YoaH (UPF0181 family)
MSMKETGRLVDFVAKELRIKHLNEGIKHNYNRNQGRANKLKEQ